MTGVLIQKVTDIGTPNVLMAGDFMLDMYVYGDAKWISPEAPVPMLKVVKREYRRGGVASEDVARHKSCNLRIAWLGKPAHDHQATAHRIGTALTRTTTDASR